MTIILPTLGVVFVAFCVWRTVRIFNRRERWAKWTLSIVLSMPVLYVASFGPACWVSSRTERLVETPAAYRPIAHLIATYDRSFLGNCLASYAAVEMRDYTSLLLPDGFRLNAYKGDALVWRWVEQRD